MLSQRFRVFAVGVALCSGTAVYGQTPSFHPDLKFEGSLLTGWQSLGQATWRAENGEVIANSGKGEGWLVLDKSYQDTGLYLSFRCEGDCDTGVLLRAKKTAGGMKGVFLSIKGSELAAYNLTLDAAGKEVHREKLEAAGGQIRFAPPPLSGAAAGRAPRGMPPLRSGPVGVTLPMERPKPGLKDGEWNDVEVLLDADILRAFFDDGSAQVSVATGEMSSYGPIALYAGG